MNPKVVLSARPLVVAVVAGAVTFTLSAGVPAASRQTLARSVLPARPDAFQTSIKPFLQTYCYGCHGGDQPTAGFDLTSYGTQESVTSDQRRWNLVLSTGVEIWLPEEDSVAALQQLAKLDASHNLLTRDYGVVDLRLPDKLYLRKRTAGGDPLQGPV